MKRFDGSYIDGVLHLPTDKILRRCQELGQFSILVCTPDEALTRQQQNWYKMTVRQLAERTGESQGHWENFFFHNCGQGVCELEYEVIGQQVNITRPSIMSLTKQQMTVFIENIMSWAYQNPEYGVTPPDYNNKYRS